MMLNFNIENTCAGSFALFQGAKYSENTGATENAFPRNLKSSLREPQFILIFGL